ncbi:GMC oxidoreductase [Xylaria cf. heliscus]|nr:GMC oxidoreductase [Xylaria cf. heliscus]
MASVFDFIIVGGGTAGLVLAARLSEAPDIRVLVIEAGEDLTSDPRVNMPAMSQSLINTPSNWRLQTVPQFHVYGGRVLGGSSALNTFIFIPPSENIVNAWSALGNPGWDWPNFSSSMANAYTMENSPWGTVGKGPLHISVAAEETQWPTTWRDTISNLGFPVSMNPLSGKVQGAHTTPESVHPVTKLRSYAGSAYLEPARSRSNMTIWTETLVEKVIFDQDDRGDPIAAGVQYVRNGVRNIVKARKEVILSAGTIHSPKILELSGVGNAEILHPLGIDIVIKNPHVGENLQNHVYLGLTSEVVKQDRFETLDGLLQGDPAAIAAAQEALKQGRGPLTGANISASATMPLPILSSETGKQQLDRLFQGFNEEADSGKVTPAFAKAHESFVRSVLSSPTEASALYTMFPGGMAFAENGDPLPHPGDALYLTFAIHLAHPLSRGSTHITSASPSAPGLEVDPKYLSHPIDLEVLAQHIQLLEKIKKTEPLAKHFVRDGKRVPPEGDLSDLDVAKEYARKACIGAFHFTGTCSLMPREMGGVVDEKCRVYGCKNLRICDLSIVPLIPRCNTQATAYGVAEHVAKIIKSGLDEEKNGV